MLMEALICKYAIYQELTGKKDKGLSLSLSLSLSLACSLAEAFFS